MGFRAFDGQARRLDDAGSSSHPPGIASSSGQVVDITDDDMGVEAAAHDKVRIANMVTMTMA